MVLDKYTLNYFRIFRLIAPLKCVLFVNSKCCIFVRSYPKHRKQTYNQNIFR